MQLLTNYKLDILQSRKIPLLIELSKKDLNGLCENDTSRPNISLAVAKELMQLYKHKVLFNKEKYEIFMKVFVREDI